ncbi:MAG: phosphoenolpyruvate kinase [Deltaproteobacteria bacterium]|nr:phosphoenolpyruvate kinase [Deltaproteobacteria bacterium]
MKTALSVETLHTYTARLTDANRAFNARYPGESGVRQPVHTVYGGANLFKAETARKLGGIGLKTLEQYAPTAGDFAAALGISGDAAFAKTVYDRVVEKLKREPIEDFRIDFEDGYGNRSDAEEDGHAEAAAVEVAKGMAEGVLPPFIGIRVKTFSEELKLRAIRTLDIFLSTLAEKSGARLPANFVVTIPKVTIPEQIAVLVDLFEHFERTLGYKPGSLKLEAMIETTQSILNALGEATIPHLLNAARGRMVAAHFGTYDYTASCNVTAAYQSIQHASCDYAKEVMQVTLAGTGVWVSDGATTIMPITPHKAKEGAALTAAQVGENKASVYRAWKLHYDNVMYALAGGYYQGWDLHPGQLPTRYAAMYTFFLSGRQAASNRLKNFVEKAAQATLHGDTFDDAATGQGLLNFFLRGVNCGALTEDEALLAGVTVDELRGRSFLKILQNRRK